MIITIPYQEMPMTGREGSDIVAMQVARQVLRHVSGFSDDMHTLLLNFVHIGNDRMLFGVDVAKLPADIPYEMREEDPELGFARMFYPGFYVVFDCRFNGRGEKMLFAEELWRYDHKRFEELRPSLRLGEVFVCGFQYFETCEILCMACAFIRCKEVPHEMYANVGRDSASLDQADCMLQNRVYTQGFYKRGNTFHRVTKAFIEKGVCLERELVKLPR